MSVLNNSLLLTGDNAGYQIQRSIRLNAPDSAYLSRTPSSAGNRKTWTYSTWLKICSVSGLYNFWLFAASSGSNNDDNISIVNSKLGIQYYGAVSASVSSASLFRDPSAWYHIVVAVDTTQATASNRIKLYVNGGQITTFATASYPAQNAESTFNAASPHNIGRNIPNNNVQSNGYLADIHFIDGQALTPSSFGEFDTTTGVWVPKQFTGSYGSQGWKLDFADNSAATAAALGKDTSGNGNNWTPTNLSVSAGAGNDSLVDVPTTSGTDNGNGGEIRGNYLTWNPLRQGSSTSLTNGNLDVATGATAYGLATGTIGVRSGKYYWEITVNSASGGSIIGIVDEVYPTGNYIGQASSSVGYNANGYLMADGNTGVALAATYTAGDVIGVALDMDASEVKFYKNNSLQHTRSSLAAKTWFPAISSGGGGNSTFTLNAGARSFAYAAPSGFKALCTSNLPTPLVTKSSSVFDVLLYTGDAASTKTVGGLQFSPDLVWLKCRSDARIHGLANTVVGANRFLSSNQTNAEYVDDAYGYLSAFTSDGFTLSTGSINNGTFNGSHTYAAWCWDAGSTTVTNTAGSITSSVRANATAGFSIVTYTGNGSAGATVGHGLGVAPGLLIVKQRSAGATNWLTWHSSIPNTNYLLLNTTQASTGPETTVWNNTTPTSTVFTLGTSGNINTNNSTYVAYLWAPVAGFSAFGSYTGNGSASDGPFVYTGHRSRWILLKSTSTTGDWVILDAVRDTANGVANFLRPNLSDAEGNAGGLVDFCSNGFKLRNTFSNYNTNGTTYVWASFAESPFQYARAR